MHMRTVVLLTYTPDMRTTASSAAINGMGSGWAWLIPQLNLETWVDSWNVLGWLYLSPLLPSEGMQLFAEQVKDYTRSEFDSSIPAGAVDLRGSSTLSHALRCNNAACTRSSRCAGRGRQLGQWQLVVARCCHGTPHIELPKRTRKSTAQLALGAVWA